MASKRNDTKKRSGRSGKPRTILQKLSQRAQVEVADLLKQYRAGTITRLDLQTGLEEVEAQLTQMEDFIFDFKNW